MVVGVTVPVMIALTLFVRYTPLGQGDAGDGAEPDRGAAHGHQRRPRDRRHVRHRRGAGRASRASSTGSTSTPSATRWASRTALYAFTAAVLGGIGNIPGAVLGGLVIGLVGELGSAYVGDEVERGADLRDPDRDPGLPARPACSARAPGRRYERSARVLGYWPWLAPGVFAAYPVPPGHGRGDLRPAVHAAVHLRDPRRSG